MATKKTTNRAPAKKNVTKVKTVKQSKNTANMSSHIGLRREDQPFMTFQVTRQTVYWLVLGAIVILFTMWTLKLQSDIQKIYDQIDQTSALSN